METPKPTSSAPGVPGVPAGKAATGVVGNAQPADSKQGLPRVPDVKKTVVPFGGLRGGRPRQDGLVPGSDAARKADLAKKAEAEKQRRAKIRLEEGAALPPVASGLAETSQAPVAPLGGAPDSFCVEWKAEDLQLVGADVVNLWEQWTINRKIKRGTEGKLAPLVVERIAKDAAFPANAKSSLQSSCPGSLAQLFNACHVPLSLKSVIATVPALAYLIVRDLLQDSNLEKLIAEAERTGQKPEAEKSPAKKP